MRRISLLIPFALLLCACAQTPPQSPDMHYGPPRLDMSTGGYGFRAVDGPSGENAVDIDPQHGATALPPGWSGFKGY